MKKILASLKKHKLVASLAGLAGAGAAWKLLPVPMAPSAWARTNGKLVWANQLGAGSIVTLKLGKGQFQITGADSQGKAYLGTKMSDKSQASFTPNEIYTIDQLGPTVALLK